MLVEHKFHTEFNSMKMTRFLDLIAVLSLTFSLPVLPLARNGSVLRCT
jgi:hypothetical protein